MGVRSDLTGKKFGRWEVLFFSHKGKYGDLYWQCRCVCGIEKAVYAKSLKDGRSSSCGCLRTENLIERSTTHGKHKTPVWISWLTMKNRCLNNRTPAFKDYGGRGITIDPEWLKFENFYKDMGDRPEGMTLDRKDNDKGYNKDNCRWATPTEQCDNTRRNRNYTYKGKTLNVVQWSREIGIHRGTLFDRLDKQGLSFEEAITRPVRVRKKKNNKVTRVKRQIRKGEKQ